MDAKGKEQWIKQVRLRGTKVPDAGKDGGKEKRVSDDGMVGCHH